MGEIAKVTAALSNLPTVVIWGILVFILLVVLLTLTSIEVTPPLNDADLLETAAVELDAAKAEATAAADEMAAFVATQEAERAALNAELEAAQSEAADNDELQRLQVLSTSQAITIQDIDGLATEQAAVIADFEATQTAEAEATEEPTPEVTEEPTEEATPEPSADVELLESRVQELESELSGYQAEATVRADQIANLAATATAQAGNVSDEQAAELESLAATAAAQEAVIATQAAQLEAIENALGSLNSGD